MFSSTPGMSLSSGQVSSVKAVPPLRTKWNTKWLLKSCPRCRGDLFLVKNEDRKWMWECVQCARSYAAVKTQEYTASS